MSRKLKKLSGKLSVKENGKGATDLTSDVILTKSLKSAASDFFFSQRKQATKMKTWKKVKVKC